MIVCIAPQTQQTSRDDLYYHQLCTISFIYFLFYFCFIYLLFCINYPFFVHKRQIGERVGKSGCQGGMLQYFGHRADQGTTCFYVWSPILQCTPSPFADCSPPLLNHFRFASVCYKQNQCKWNNIVTKNTYTEKKLKHFQELFIVNKFTVVVSADH